MIELEIVGNEMFDLHFDDRMAAVLDGDADIGNEAWLRPAERRGLGGVCREEIKRSQRVRRALKFRHRGSKLGQQRIIESLFARQSAFLRGELLVLERLELGRDIALCVLQGLPSAIVVGYALGIGVTHFDVKTVNPVVLDLEAVDARARSLACLEFDQECYTVLRYRAKLVELCVVPGCDH